MAEQVCWRPRPIRRIEAAPIPGVRCVWSNVGVGVGGSVGEGCAREQGAKQRAPRDKSGWGARFTFAQIGPAVFMAVLAIGAWFVVAPETSLEVVRAPIADTNDANNARTEGAPQQEVVNGWRNIEYLNLLCEQPVGSDNRRDALILIGLLLPRKGGAGTRCPGHGKSEL